MGKGIPPICDGKDLFSQLLSQARWKGKDDFGYDPTWNEEHSRWLQVAQRHRRDESYMARLSKGQLKQRDETLAELAAAYFFEKRAGIRITDWGPRTGRGEFLIRLGSVDVFCEVKSPGWEAEVVEGKGSHPPPTRLKEQKYISEESYGYATHAILQEVINKARNKFPNGTPGLIIFSDDFRVPLIDDPLSIHRALYSERSSGCFLTEDSKWLAGVAFLNYHLPAHSSEVKYRFRVCCNPQSSWPDLPENAFGPWIDRTFPPRAWWKVE